MNPVVLVGDHGHRIAFKITTAKVYSLEVFMETWTQGWATVYLTDLNNPQYKPKRLSAAVIRDEFPQYVDSPYYRSINY